MPSTYIATPFAAASTGQDGLRNATLRAVWLIAFESPGDDSLDAVSIVEESTRALRACWDLAIVIGLSQASFDEKVAIYKEKLSGGLNLSWKRQKTVLSHHVIIAPHQ